MAVSQYLRDPYIQGPLSVTLATSAGALVRPIRLESPDPAPARWRAVLTTSSLILQGLVRLAISVLVGKEAGPSALAQIAAGLAAASILSLLWPSATGAAASRFIAAAQTAGNVGETYRVAAHLGRRTAQASFALAPLGGGYWLLTGGSVTGAGTISLLTLGLGGYAFVRGVHNGSRQLVRLVVWDLAASLGGVVAVATMLSRGHTDVTVLTPLAISYIALSVFGWPRGGHGKAANSSEMDHFVLWATLGSLASSGLIHITMLLAEHRLLETTAGQFAAAINLVAPAALFANSFSMVLFPEIAAAFAIGDEARAVALTRRATDALVLIMGAAFGALVLLAPWIVDFLWGVDFGPAAAIFPVLSIGPLARAVSMPAVASLSSRERAGVRAATTASFTGLAAAGLVWACFSEAGWFTVAAGYSTALVVTAVRLMVKAARRDGLALMGASARLVIGGLAVTAIYLLRNRLEWSLTMTTLASLGALGVWAMANRTALCDLIQRRVGT